MPRHVVAEVFALVSPPKKNVHVDVESRVSHKHDHLNSI